MEEHEKCGMSLDELVNSIGMAFGRHEIASLVHIQPLAKLLMDRPDEAIDQIIKAYDKGLNDAYTDEKGWNARGYIQAIAGGPHECVPQAVYNAVGSVYPYLNREQKDRALGKIVRGILDGINYLYVQISHTPGIKEPLLLSDISIVRSLYWPGMDEGHHICDKFRSFGELKEKLIDENGMFNQSVSSDYIVAYSLLRKDFSKFSEEYLKVVNPKFLDRVLHGIVAMRFWDKTTDKKKIKEGTDRLRFLLPEQLHPRIEPIREKADWADYGDFR